MNKKSNDESTSAKKMNQKNKKKEKDAEEKEESVGLVPPPKLHHPCPSDADLPECDQWCSGVMGEDTYQTTRGGYTCKEELKEYGPRCSCYDKKMEVELAACTSTCSQWYKENPQPTKYYIKDKFTGETVELKSYDEDGNQIYPPSQEEIQEKRIAAFKSQRLELEDLTEDELKMLEDEMERSGANAELDEHQKQMEGDGLGEMGEKNRRRGR